MRAITPPPIRTEHLLDTRRCVASAADCPPNWSGSLQRYVAFARISSFRSVGRPSCPRRSNHVGTGKTIGVEPPLPVDLDETKAQESAGCRLGHLRFAGGDAHS